MATIIGAFVGGLILTFIVRWFAIWLLPEKLDGYTRILVANGLSAAICIGAHAAFPIFGYTLLFAAAIYALAQCVWLARDIFRFSRNDDRAWLHPR
jgi:fructose-specific phosphotransferase system IIC component